MAEPLELEPEDGSIFIEYELWDYEWTREKSGFWRSRESGHERLQKLAYRGWVRIPPGDYEAMLDALDRVFNYALNDDHYRALTAAIEHDGDRRRIGPAVRDWARDVAADIAADQAATVVGVALRIVAAFFGMPHMHG